MLEQPASLEKEQNSILIHAGNEETKGQPRAIWQSTALPTKVDNDQTQQGKNRRKEESDQDHRPACDRAGSGHDVNVAHSQRFFAQQQRADDPSHPPYCAPDDPSGQRGA